MAMDNNPFEAFSKSDNVDMQVSQEQFAVNVANNATSPLFASLSNAMKERALQLALHLETKHYEEVLSFGLPAQEALKKFTAQMLQYIQRKDVRKVGDVLADLLHHLELINPDALIEQEQGFFAKLFSKPKQSIQEIMTHYNKLSKRIDRLSIQLEHSQNALLMDYQFLNELYAMNEDYFQEINVYIASLEIKKQHLADVVLPAIEKQQLQENDAFGHVERKDIQMQIEWLDRRMYDLQLSREVAIQYAPQIRMIQQTNQMLIEKIHSSIMTTIPLWQQQISMLLSINNQRRAIQSQERLMNASEQLMRKNGKMLEVTNNTTKRSKLSHQEVDRFKATQLQLLQDIEDTLRMQVTTDEKRLEIEHSILESK